MKAMLTTVAVGGLAACAAFGGERIVFVGDSITGQSRNNAAGYAHQLDAAYAATIAEAANRPTVVSLGGSGQTVESWKNVELRSRDDATAKLDVDGVYVKENLDQPADKMVIMLGMNNILSPSTVDTPASLAAFRNNYYELVTNLVRRATPTDLYLASSPPCTEDPDGPKNLLMKKLWAILQELAAELPTDETCLAAQPNLRVHYLPTGEDQLEVLAQGRLLSPTFHTTGDMVHPGGTGHMRLAQTFLDGFGHTAASEWLVANRLQPSLDQVAAGNQAGLSYAVAYTGHGSAPGLYAFTIRANWVTRPGETAPASAAFAISLPEGWAETTEAAADGLATTFAVEGPADLFENRLCVTATPASGEARTVTVTIPAPWRVSTPVVVPWSNSTGKWVFPVETAACETEAAILAQGALATVEAASATRTPAWVDLFATPDYVGGADAASLDFSAVGHAETFGTSYAARYVYAKRPVAATLSIGSSAFSATLHTTIWLNGEQVLASDAATSVSVQLRQGNNLMVVRSSHLNWQWQIAVGLAAEDNSFDLRYGLAELSESGSAPEGADYAPTKTMLGDGSELYSCVSNYTFTARCGGRLDIFLVGGGGGGGGNTEDEIVDQPGIQTGGGYECRAGGGGGGGGVVVRTGIPVKAGDVFPIAVGQGGAANQNGEPTVAFGFEALGGGHGGTKSVQATAGGSAGAPGANWATRTAFPGLAAAVPSDGVAQGHASGGGYSVEHNYFGAGGGGGGAGGPGSDGWTVTDGGDGTATTNFVRGIGGPGLACPFALADTLYGAGGNGGLSNYDQQNPAKNFGADGADGLGQGGGGCNSYVHVSAGRGGRGGSGCVIFRFYPDEIDAEAYPGKPAVSTLPDGSFIYTFAETGIFRAPSAGTISAFLVGGGGGGGGNTEDEIVDQSDIKIGGGYECRAGGGGGGGGVRYVESVTVEKRDYVIAVGRGGDQNRNGEPTQAFGFEALGGGHGGTKSVQATAGGSAGAPGANGATLTAFPGLAAAVPSDGVAQGHASGGGYSVGNNLFGAGGGGGGAGGPGSDGWEVTDGGDGTTKTNVVRGIGGPGLACPFALADTLYGAGGNGGFSDYGQTNPAKNFGADGTDGLGQGGGGCNSYVHVSAGRGGRGGSGTVIIRFVPGDDYYASMVKQEAEGGVKRKVNGWITHEFTESGTLVVNQPMRVEVLLVGGGGAGGKADNVRGGGGGAGGVVIKTGVPLIDGEYAVSVGAGGVNYGESGGDSSFNGFVAVGGGGGGSSWNKPGKDGGSGGGGAGPYRITGETVAGGAGTEGQGCAGGCGTWNGEDTNGGAGGGGGAGGPGEDAVNGRSGKGGAAIACDFLGKGRYYAAGGGGGKDAHGGFGGEVELGGHGGYNAGAGGLVPGGDGVAGTGSGGGGEDGSGNLNTGWGKGGSGVVVIRYRPVPKGLLLKLR